MRGPTKAGLKTLLRFKVRALPAMVTLEPGAVEGFGGLAGAVLGVRWGDGDG